MIPMFCRVMRKSRVSAVQNNLCKPPRFETIFLSSLEIKWAAAKVKNIISPIVGVCVHLAIHRPGWRS
jgi:hypothetical protein